MTLAVATTSESSALLFTAKMLADALYIIEFDKSLLSRSTCSFGIVLRVRKSATSCSTGRRWTRFTRTKNLYETVSKSR